MRQARAFIKKGNRNDSPATTTSLSELFHTAFDPFTNRKMSIDPRPRERQLSLHAFPVLVFRGHMHGLADGTHAVLTPSVVTQKHPSLLTVFDTTRGRGAATHVHQKNFRRGTVGKLAFADLCCTARGMRKEEETMLLILDAFSTSLCCEEETGLCCKALHCLCFCGPQVGKKE